MPENIKEHEEINLHIKKRTAFRILRGLIVIPLATYLFWCLCYATSTGTPNMWLDSTIKWYYIGTALSLLFVVICGVYLIIEFIKGE